MGISVGVLALICALVLLFGVQSTRKILGWSFGLIISNWDSRSVWVWPMLQTPQFNPSAPKLLSDEDVGLAPNYAAVMPPNNGQWWQNDPVVAPPPFDPSKPYDVVHGATPAASNAPSLSADTLAGAFVEALDQQIARTNSQTPITLDAITKIKHVSRVERLITFEYEVALAANKWTDDHRKDVSRIATKANCIDDTQTRKMLDAGFNVRHLFWDPAGLLDRCRGPINRMSHCSPRP
jgi:hypothetical protein